MERFGYDETNGTVIGGDSLYMVFYTVTGYRIVLPSSVKEHEAADYIRVNHPESFKVGGEIRIY